MGVKVRERKPGEWWVFVNYHGDRRAKKVGSKRAANELKAEIEKKIAAAEFQIKAPPPVPTFEKYAEKWLEGYVKASLKPSSQSCYADILKTHLIPAFGKRFINEITRKDIKDFIYAKKAAGYAPRSVASMIHRLSSIFENAIEDGIATVNPTRRPGKYIGQPKLGEEMTFLEKKEGIAVLEAAREHYPKAYPILLMAMLTGVREGELIALQWGDIDWRGKFLEVSRADWGGHLGTTKTGKSRRVDLADRLLEVLADHRKALAEDALAKGKPMSEWVFPKRWYYPTKWEDRLRGDNLRRMLSTCLKKAGVRSVTFHQLRHSFCSWMIQNGESLVYVKDQAGHSSIKVTVDVYGKLVPGENRDAMDRLGETLKKPATSAQPERVRTSNIQEIKANF
jgi:integrase